MYVCICQTEKIPSQQCDCKGNSIPVNHLQSVLGMMLKVILKHCVCVVGWSDGYSYRTIIRCIFDCGLQNRIRIYGTEYIQCSSFHPLTVPFRKAMITMYLTLVLHDHQQLHWHWLCRNVLLLPMMNKDAARRRFICRSKLTVKEQVNIHARILVVGRGH